MLTTNKGGDRRDGNVTRDRSNFHVLTAALSKPDSTVGDITSDGGVLLLRQADRLTGLSDSIARALSDPRRQASCDHDVPGLVRQRLYAIALGYEDLNDHDGLRQDVALQTAVERDQWLASASTLCRFENRADRETAWRLHEVLLDQFIASFKRAPKS